MPTSPSGDYVRRHPLETLGRTGYAVKGIVYALLGVLAFNAARGGGDPEGQEGAFATIAATTFGSLLLWVVVVGLAAYAVWRLVLAVADPEGEGDDIEGAAKRAFYVVSAFSYAALAYTAYRAVTGGAASGSAGGTEEQTQTLLSLPGGRWIVGAIALGILGYGVHQFQRAYKASFMSKFDLEGVAARHRDLVRRAGQWGLAARGVVYLIVGGFLGRAALQYDPDEAVGLDGALGILQSQPAGPWLLGAVGLGLIMYGVYCWTNAIYRRYEGGQ